MEDLKRHISREMAHIIKVWDERKLAAGYNIKYESDRTDSITWLLNHKHIECVDIIENDKAFYVFVKPVGAI